MNTDEKVAELYLQSLDTPNLQFEPDGNVPPDFAFGGKKVGIEVRRLNANFEPESGSEGLEEVYIPTALALESVLREFDSQAATESFGVILKFRRPVDRKLKFKNVLRNTLSAFLRNGHYPAQSTHHIGQNISITIIPSAHRAGCVFWVIGETDQDSGGWVTDIAIQNFNLCIAEKTGKIEKFHSIYDQWWLLLVDAIGMNLMEHEMDEVRRSISLPVKWSKLIVINYSAKEIMTIGGAEI